MTIEIKRVLLEKAKIYKKYVKNNRKDYDRNLLRNITCKCRDLIRHAKEEYFVSLGKELCDPNMGQKKYWSILHKFLNKRKIPQIPPLHNNNSFVTDFADKAELFNTYFAKQCTLINTPSTLPPFSYATHHRLNKVDFVPEKLTSIIKSLNPATNMKLYSLLLTMEGHCIMERVIHWDIQNVRCRPDSSTSEIPTMLVRNDRDKREKWCCSGATSNVKLFLKTYGEVVDNLPPIKGGSIVERAPVHGSNFVRSYTKCQPHRKSSLPYPDFWQFELSWTVE